jgi:hypothetical protein
MMRTWKTFGMKAILAAAFLAPPALAAADSDAPKTTDARLEEITKQLTRMETSLKEVGDLKSELAKVSREIGILQRDLTLKVQQDQATQKDLSERIDKLERMAREEITRLNEDLRKLRAGPSTQSSLYTPNQGPPPAAGSGRIRLVNDSFGTVTITLNGKPHTLPPRQSTLLENQPAGRFTYDVQAEGFGVIRPPSTRELAANDTYTIEVFPR